MSSEVKDTSKGIKVDDADREALASMYLRLENSTLRSANLQLQEELVSRDTVVQRKALRDKQQAIKDKYDIAWDLTDPTVKYNIQMGLFYKEVK